MEERLALIDIGSNTIRLVIFEFSDQTGLTEILNIKTPARLSQYLTEDNDMNDQGIRVLTETLSSFKDVAQHYHVAELHPIATAALRQSNNQQTIIQTIKERLAIDIQVIPEQDEAFYGYFAITHTTNINNGISVDIGGGSTEITLFKDNQIKEAHSFPFGVVTLNRLFFDGKDHNDKQALKDLNAYLKDQFKQLDWIQNQELPLVGVGGSARNVARIHQSAQSYPIGGVHNYTMSKKDITSVYNLIVDSSRDELINLDGLSRDRVDIILPAVSVFRTLYAQIDATQFTFSRKGLREGYVLYLLEQRYPVLFTQHNVQQNALRHLANEYHIESTSAQLRLTLAQSLLTQILAQSNLTISDDDQQRFIEGAYLYYLGSFIDTDSSSPHTYYLIANSTIYGFSHKERVKLALLASFKNKSLLKQYAKETNWFDSNELETLQKLGGIIKFVNALNISHTAMIKNLKLESVDDNHYELEVHHKGQPIAEIYQAQRQKKHLEKALKGKVNIQFITD